MSSEGLYEMYFGRLQDMNLKQEHLLELRNQKNKALDNEVTETLTAQVSWYIDSSWD